ncbi:hypothetical protein DYY67_0773 [Candidatus Nitrosotalea sp. TS]|nr:hypothetical protein [Candidatus Nitrosotalea sp. TS]
MDVGILIGTDFNPDGFERVGTKDCPEGHKTTRQIRGDTANSRKTRQN